MSVSKKIMISLGWLTAFGIASLLVYQLRHIGTTWINELGFLRVITLLSLTLSTLIPLVLAILVWFGKPKRLYEKLQ